MRIIVSTLFLLCGMLYCTSAAELAVPQCAGISKKQHKTGLEAAEYIHLFDWTKADKQLLELQKIELKDSLPPLSSLLSLAERIIRIQNNEYASKKELNILINEIDSIQLLGLSYCKIKKNRITDPKLLATFLFIEGGIKGFLATLKIDSNPLEALSDALSAVRLLNEALDKNPNISDAYLGLGLFHAIVSSQPRFVRFALTMFATHADLDTGLVYLKTSSESGQYTRTIAKLYRTEFLSPYYGHTSQEKAKIYADLQKTYPTNPYYTFLESEENICFHKEKFYSSYTAKQLEKAIKKCHNRSYLAKRYNQLCIRQLHLLDSNSMKYYKIDESIDLQSFSYYPLFINAKTAYRLALKKNNSLSQSQTKEILDLKQKALDMLSEKPMTGHTRRFFQWHIREAIKLDALPQERQERGPRE